MLKITKSGKATLKAIPICWAQETVDSLGWKITQSLQIANLLTKIKMLQKLKALKAISYNVKYLSIKQGESKRRTRD